MFLEENIVNLVGYYTLHFDVTQNSQSTELFIIYNICILFIMILVDLADYTLI